MRFMAFMITGVYKPGKKIDANFTPQADKMEKMGQFNAELGKACKILALGGLHPHTTGARLSFAGGKAQVTDGPFVEAKEVVGGYWMLEADSKEQVVNWMKRFPSEHETAYEIRQVFEMSDFPIQVQKAAQR